MLHAAGDIFRQATQDVGIDISIIFGDDEDKHKLLHNATFMPFLFIFPPYKVFRIL
jgi:hypothetical protein